MIKFPTKKYSKSNKYFADYINIKDLLLKKVDQKILLKIIQMISSTIKKKRSFFSCGNGGSATTAEHLTCDFSKGVMYKYKFKYKSFFTKFKCSPYDCNC